MLLRWLEHSRSVLEKKIHGTTKADYASANDSSAAWDDDKGLVVGPKPPRAMSHRNNYSPQ